MENIVIFCGPGGSVSLPRKTLNGREDGGHLIVSPGREVWDRSELSLVELFSWSLLVAATGHAMLNALPQLIEGCINYWDAGNWSLNGMSESPGPKMPRVSRKLHLHVFGRSRNATHPDWQWGESPRFPSYANSSGWAAQFSNLSRDECAAIVEKIGDFMAEKGHLE